MILARKESHAGERAVLVEDHGHMGKWCQRRAVTHTWGPGMVVWQQGSVSLG